jgi:hypothetical protein
LLHRGEDVDAAARTRSRRTGIAVEQMARVGVPNLDDENAGGTSVLVSFGAGDGNRTRVVSSELCPGLLALSPDLGQTVQRRALVDRALP